MPGTLNIDVNISVNGTTLPTQHFEGTSPSSTTINVTSYLNAIGTNAFNFTSTGSGRVTYEISLDYFVPRLAVRTDPTLSLTKSITPVIAPGGQGTVTLNFTPSDDVGYVIINDYIPGGFTLDTSSITAGIAYEVSGDRITFALQSVEANDTVTISYSMTAPQATLGQINVRGAECLLMYQPTITGSSAGVTTQVQTAVPGDANGDGNVNALDITKVERIIALLDAETLGADANQDGNVNALDITKVERIIVGLG
jgi:hypothetical protein